MHDILQNDKYKALRLSKKDGVYGNAILEALVEFINDENTDLLKLPLYTGLGKTRFIQMWLSCIDWENTSTKIFFQSPTKNNLKEDELEKFFNKYNNQDSFGKYVLRLDNQIDMFANNYAKMVVYQKNLSEYLSNKFDENSKLKQHLILLNSCLKHLTPVCCVCNKIINYIYKRDFGK